jgi:hypothetical protein
MCFPLLFAFAAITIAPPQTQLSTTPINVYDGFETPTLSPLWSTDRLEPNSIRMESHTVRAGHQAIAITVRPHDTFEAGNAHSADSERDELMEARSLIPHIGRAQEYSFSEYFPSDFPVVPVRLVIAQWKLSIIGFASQWFVLVWTINQWECPRWGKTFFQSTFVRNPFGDFCRHCALRRPTQSELTTTKAR